FFAFDKFRQDKMEVNGEVGQMKTDAVFEGGGVKGIAFIGAISVMEEHGFEWHRLSGTSAGSIVAALLSAGYNSQELTPVFQRLNYLSFLQQRGLARLPYIGGIAGLLFKEGIYPSDNIEKFVDELLARKGVRVFGDLPGGKLRIIASDITAGKMLIFPDDLTDFDLDPDNFPIARAVRMSCSIPYFFYPYRMKKNGGFHYIVDGGLLSNFPVWLFDGPGLPEWPAFGFRLANKATSGEKSKIRGLISFSKALLTTMLDAHDRFHIEHNSAVRTVFIPTLGIRTTQFNLSEAKRVELIASGRKATEAFLQTWSFQEYCNRFRDHPSND
ncbi:patatin-like phospholipase family protein, partial [Brevibacillus massiliensis]|uniref:patatin-like phospholipase family protein n=1 Tax=Brevibacillus massiliensis TaxID=1118054 RepID=UPI001FDFA2E0